MDEPELRALIQTLTKRLLPEFEKVTEPEERVRLVLGQPELGAEFSATLFAAEWPRKNEEVAKRNREDGNSAFTSGNHELAITLYTEAMKYAKVHETLWEGETMAIAAANRYITQNSARWRLRQKFSGWILVSKFGYIDAHCLKMTENDQNCLI